jgi:hypothetical protein
MAKRIPDELIGAPGQGPFLYGNATPKGKMAGFLAKKLRRCEKTLCPSERPETFPRADSFSTENRLSLDSVFPDRDRIQGLTSELRENTEPLSSFLSRPALHGASIFYACVSGTSKDTPLLSVGASVQKTSAIFKKISAHFRPQK